MGRHLKTVLDVNGIDRRASGYYSTPSFVAEFLADLLLELGSNTPLVFDPCVGQGELTVPFRQRGLKTIGIDIVDMNPDVDEYVQSDFLEFFSNQSLNSLFDIGIDLPYDIYVANPPYNCHEIDYIRKNKEDLKSLFGKSAALNMYSLFLHALIDCAKPGALIGVITHDSFLSARGHAPLRDKILRLCSIHYLLLCPTDLFLDQGADVRTCILVLQKGKEHQGSIRTLNRPKSTSDFHSRLRTRRFDSHDLQQIILLNGKDHREFLLGVPDQVTQMFCHKRVGDLFDCVTGISTGNDGKYLSKRMKPGFSIPFYKNPASRRFYTKPDAFLINDFLSLDKSIPNFMVRNKHLLFRPGIACSSMGVAFGAAYLPENSTFGVNSNIILNEKDTWWVLAYLNSSLASYIVRGILIRSNMVTSGYVSRLPVPPMSSKAKTEIGDLARQAYECQIKPPQSKEYVSCIDRVLNADLCLEETCIRHIRSFVSDIIRNT